MYDKDIMNRKKEIAVTVIAQRFLASILCLSMLLTAVFPDGGTAFAASLNQELPSAVSEGSVNKLSDSSSEEDTDSETMPSAEAADADDASKELQDVPLAPAVGGEPLSAEELAREEELFKKRAEAARLRMHPGGRARRRLPHLRTSVSPRWVLVLQSLTAMHSRLWGQRPR